MPSIALLQINGIAGAVRHNREQLRRAADGASVAAGKQAVLCVAPELSLSGTPLGTLPQQTPFLHVCSDQLALLAAELPAGVTLITGCPELRDGALFSSLFQLSGGAVTRLCSRPLAEALLYGPARQDTVSTADLGHMNWQGMSLCVSLGLNALAQAGRLQADALVCADAEPFETSTWRTVVNRCAAIARRHETPLWRVNSVGGSENLIFPGGSLILLRDGRMAARAASWRQELLLEDPCVLSAMAPAEDGETGWGDVWHALVLGIRDYVRKSGFERAVLGLSGGMDSSLVASLAVEALGPDRVTGLLMPSPWSSRGSLDDAALLASNLGITTHLVPISPVMDAFNSALAPAFSGMPQDVTEENLQARIRGSLLMAYSNKFKALVLSTGNKSEAAVGYGTLYGDLAGGLAPIVDIYKTDVYKLAAHYNSLRGQEIIPRSVFEKAPSAELHPGQKDQDSLPPYDILDSALRVIFEGCALPEQAACAGIDEITMQRVASMIRRSEFKRHQATPGLFVSARPLAMATRPLPAEAVL